MCVDIKNIINAFFFIIKRDHITYHLFFAAKEPRELVEEKQQHTNLLGEWLCMVERVSAQA